jgi:hypothetical protein
MNQQLGGYVYVLHFSKPISPKHTTQHYAGWTYHMASRIDQHLHGRGARLTQVAIEPGITFEIAAIFPGDRNYERKIKNSKNLRRYCSVCKRAHDPRQLTLNLAEEDLL